MELEPQTMLAGRYCIAGTIAQGGMGVVYRAYDERLDRLVAIKTVRQDDADLLVRLRREARLLARLTHPNVVSLYDVGDHEGRPYLVTQLVDGVPLRGLLGRMSPRRIAWVGEQVAHGLAAAHAVGIVHRDLKPSNVLVGDGTVRILDFGIARHIDDTTQAGVDAILGTASYISPEQLRGRPAGPEADIYALGLVLVECFSGRPAFEGTFDETVDRRLAERPELPESMPAAWHGLVAAMTDPDPGQRPPASAVAPAMRALGRTRAGTEVGPGISAVDGRPVGEHGAPAPGDRAPGSEPDPLTWSRPQLAPALDLAWAEPVAPAAASSSASVIGRRLLLGFGAALASFMLVVGVGYAFSAGDRGEIDNRPIALATPDTEPVNTLPVTEPSATTSTTMVPEVLPSETSAPPPSAPVITRPPAPAPPPTTAAPTTARPRPTTTTTAATRRCRGWWCTRNSRG